MSQSPPFNQQQPGAYYSQPRGCPRCGMQNDPAAPFCAGCNAQMTPAPPGYQGYTPGGQPPQPWREMGADKKMTAGICGILLGGFGIHKFVLGYNTEGLIMLLVTVLTCGIGAMVMGPIGLIEGIIYLTKTDEDFVRTYVQSKKGWF